MSKFNLNNEHELIDRQNNYVLDRKLITIHSEDRDIKKWPNPNTFEIQLPEAMINVQSIRLVEISLPSNYYVFSNQYQNTKFSFDLDPSSNSPIATDISSGKWNKIDPIIIDEGFYTPSQMENELKNKMNKAVIHTAYGTTVPTASYEYFKVHYDEVAQKMWIGNPLDNFRLAFNQRENYTKLENCVNPNVWEQYTKWGLPSYLGYEKKSYEAIDGGGEAIVFDYHDPPITFVDASNGTGPYYTESDNTICMFGESAIYMEVDKYNSMDELVPYSESTSNMYNNDYNGSVNASFAKIPVIHLPHSQIFESRNDFIQNMSHYHPPIDKIRKLKFRFRYHDGRLVDFRKCNFNFTISFYMLRDEIAREYNLRTPGTYTL